LPTARLVARSARFPFVVDVATSTVYGELQHEGVLPDSYEVQALPIVNKQLERAGVRLAKVLNESLE